MAKTERWLRRFAIAIQTAWRSYAPVGRGFMVGFITSTTQSSVAMHEGRVGKVLAHLITADDKELISDALLAHGRDLVNHGLKLLNGYVSYLKRREKPLASEQ